MRTIFLIITLFIAVVSQSQDINYFDRSESPMHETRIDPQTEFVSGATNIDLFLRIKHTGEDQTDYEGKTIILDEYEERYLIKIEDQNSSIITPPGEESGSSYNCACLTNDGKKAVYSAGDNTVSVLDIGTKQLIYQHTFKSENNIRIEWIRINDDASLIFASVNMFDGYHTYIFKLNGEKYDVYEGGNYQKTNFPFISSSDERVYFVPQANDKPLETDRFGYIDPNFDNYKTFIDTPLPEINGDYVQVIDIVEHGKVFILSVGQNIAGIKQTKRYYSASMIDDIHFGEPSLIGEIVLDPYYDSMSRWPAKSQELMNYASEDGKVLVAQVLKRVEMDKDYYYDAYAFLKNPAGKWIKKKINPSNEDIKDRMLLSGNGRSLFWNRWPLAAVKNGFFK